MTGEVTAVHGVRSHFHYRFISKGKLAMRWLACCCDPCMAHDFASCITVAYVGAWREVNIDHARLGIRVDTQRYREMSLEMHTALAVGDIVAIYTHADPIPRRKFWLGKVLDKGFAAGPIQCPASGTKHSKGAAIISLQ
jgi:hypothetical protein